MLLSNLKDIDPFEAIREEEVCLEDILGFPINPYDKDGHENITLPMLTNFRIC